MKLINKNTNEIINVSFAYTQENLIAYGKTDYLEVPKELEDCTCLKVVHGVVIEDTAKDIEQKTNEIKERYKEAMNDYVYAKIKRDLFLTDDYQLMVTDMYNEIEAL
jgi:hypothetical protein